VTPLPRFVAIGDVHGELRGFQAILLAEKLINSEGHWLGGETTLLQIGDIVDRGPFSFQTFEFIRNLQMAAEKAGGRVIRLFGNHELLMLQGNFFFCNFQGPEKLAEEIREEILNGKIQTAFAWEGRLYTHAGLRFQIFEEIQKHLSLPPQLTHKHYEKLAKHLNQAVLECLRVRDFSHPLFWVDETRGGDDPVGGIFWSDYSDLIREELHPLYQVMGHTPAFQMPAGLRWTEDLKNINLEAGMYRGYGGNRAWLVVEKDRLITKQLLRGKIVETVLEPSVQPLKG
jgi:hypothetical protein